MEIPLLSDIVILLGLSVLIVLIFQKLKLPAILGFLITGIIVGPHGLNLISAVHEVELLSEIGIIFLLFVIGIEFSLKGLATIKNTVLVGGMLQVAGTVGMVALTTYWLGLSIQSAIFMGFLLSLSSTAIVLKMLQENGELTSPHGKVSVAILIFQDIVVVVFILLTPILAGQSENPGLTVVILTAKVIGVVVAVIVLARYVVPVLFRMVVKTKSRELFILTTVVLCFATAWLTSSVGLSLALGAFFAGLIISESEYSHQATANILPFREIFMSFFFVSVGMLLDFRFFLDQIGIICLLVIGVILLKILIVCVAVYLLRYPARTVFLTAFILFQVGEFAFLLSTVGMEYELLSDQVYQYFLSISIISMGATPFIISASPRIVRFILRTPLPPRVRKRMRAISKKRRESIKLEEQNYHDHLIIVGYGINGENVARSAQKAEIPYVIIDLDPDAIQRAKEKGEPVVFGDASDELILKHVHVQEARVVVIAISANDATRQIVRTIRMFSETTYVIVRTRYVKEVGELVKLGADEVIPEEFETSIEIFSRVLKKYLVPNHEILGFVSEIRSHNYEMLRGLPGSRSDTEEASIHIPEMEIAALHVQQGKNRIVGKTLQDSGIRSEFKLTVLAIKRGDKYITALTQNDTIESNDVLYLFGKPDDIIRINKYFTFG